MRVFVSLLVLIISFSSCYRDTSTSRCAYEEHFDFENDCRDVEQSIIINGTISAQVFEGTERYCPEFNPQSENEIAFVLVDRTENPSKSSVELVFADLRTGEHRFGHKLRDINTLYWNDEYIMLGGVLDDVYHIKTKTIQFVYKNIGFIMSGSSWHSKAGQDYIYGWLDNEDWNPDLDAKIKGAQMVRVKYPSLEVERVPFFDNLTNHYTDLAISQNGQFVYDNTEEIMIYNESSNNSEVLFQSKVSIGNGGKCYDWHPNNKDVYFISDGIFYFKKGENKQVRIKKSCPSRKYEWLTVSPTGDKIVASRRDIKARANGTYISENTKLVIMDIDGCNEKVLFEDWDGTVIGRP